jgi:hypothetical protein
MSEGRRLRRPGNDPAGTRGMEAIGSRAFLRQRPLPGAASSSPPTCGVSRGAHPYRLRAHLYRLKLKPDTMPLGALLIGMGHPQDGGFIQRFA